MTENRMPYKPDESFTGFFKAIKNDRLFFAGIFLFSIIFHVFLWYAYPFHFGPDGQMYIIYFIDTFSQNNLFPNFLTYVMPAAPLFYGLLLKTGSLYPLMVISELLSLSTLPMIYFIFNKWGRSVSRLATAALVILIPYQVQFHQVSSDALFSWLVLLYFVVFKLFLEHKDYKNTVFLGVVSAACILTRQIGIILFINFVFFLLLKINIRKTAALIATGVLTIAFLLSPFLIYKYNKFGDFSISRGSNYLEFSRVYTLQKPAVDASNGFYSEKLVIMVKENILNTELYKKYNVDVEKFFNFQPNRRFFHDIIVTVDRVEGWSSNYELLRKVAFEAIKKDPANYLWNYFKDLGKIIIKGQELQGQPLKTGEIDFTDSLPNPERQFPEQLSENELIPYSNIWWGLTNPQGKDPDLSELREFGKKFDALTYRLENPESLTTAFTYLNRAWKYLKIPAAVYWIFAAAGMVVSFQRENRLLIISIFAVTVLALVVTVYGSPAYLRYRMPFEPFIAAMAIAGLKEIIVLIRRKREKRKLSNS